MKNKENDEIRQSNKYDFSSRVEKGSVPVVQAE
jgi:hypothetical protein